jgi:carboxyl-terminal processing protease
VALVTTLIVGSVAFAAGTGFGATLARAIDTPRAVTDRPATPGEPTEFGLFWEAWDILKQHYVDQPGLVGKDLTYGAIRGLTTAIGDTGHTRFLTPEQLKLEQDDLSGKFAGVGVYYAQDGTDFVVQSVIPGTPAERAGVRAGDRIVAVDGKPTSGKTVNDLASEVRGEEGTQVTLTLVPKDGGDAVDVTITREIITNPAVSWAMYPGTTTTVIRLEQFSLDAGAQMVEALTAARAAGATRFVLDLRNNPGGYVGDAVKVASQFLGDGVVYISQDGKGDRTEVPVTPGGVATAPPLVVLVDNGSASSAEIVSGAIQDAGRGKIVGETTFGTGTVLAPFTLSDGSALYVGTVEWLTRDGHLIWRKGITPDVVVAIPSDGRIVVPSEFEKLGGDGIKASKDAQLEKAIELVGAQ